MADKEKAINTNKPNLVKAASIKQNKNSLPNFSLYGNPGKKDNSVQPII